MKKNLLLAVLALLVSAPKFAHATNDGTPSTGSFTVVYNSSLTATTATGSLVVVDTVSLLGTTIRIGPYALLAGRDFLAGTSTVTAALSLTSAINTFPGTGSGPYPYMPVIATFAAGNASISLAAIDVGSFYNAVPLRTSNTGEVTVSGTNLTGGQNNASISINSVQLVQGRDWFAQDVSSNTAISISAAINRAAGLANTVKGYFVSTAQIYLRSILTAIAYPLSVSDNSATNANITVSGPTMTGGAAGNLAYVICDIGNVNALPTSLYPEGCKAYLLSNHVAYISTGPVTNVGVWSPY